MPPPDAVAGAGARQAGDVHPQPYSRLRARQTARPHRAARRRRQYALKMASGRGHHQEILSGAARRGPAMPSSSLAPRFPQRYTQRFPHNAPKLSAQDRTRRFLSAVTLAAVAVVLGL